MAAGNLASLEAALERLRLDGAIFVRAEYSEAWAYESLDGADTAAILRPGADRLILFHVVAAGRCWLTCGDDGERYWAEAGDVIVLPYGDHHFMGGVEPADPVNVGELLTPPPWEAMPVIHHGCGGARTRVVCGYLESDDPLFDPRLRALPPIFVVRPPAGPASKWVEASIEYAIAATAPGASIASARLAARLPELLLVEALRLHLATAPAAEQGWVAALRDPVLGPAMALLHTAPARRWTVADLAAEVAVSRSLLDERFRRVLSRSPIRYLTEWRMHLADELLNTTDLGIAEIARRVGYDSEEAFSRAFKRERGLPPSEWRTRGR